MSSSAHIQAAEQLISARCRVTSDGPFAETKERLVGYYLIEAGDLDRAVDRARKMPSIPSGGAVEVRPIRVLH